MLSTKLIFYLLFCVWTGNGSPNLLSPSASYDADQCATSNRFKNFNNVKETLEINGVCSGPIDIENYTDITFVDYGECQKYFDISIKDTEASILLKESLDEVFDNDRLSIAPCPIIYKCADGSSYTDFSVVFNILPENDNPPFFWDNNNTAVVNISKQFTPGMPIPGFNIIAQDNDFKGNELDYQDNVILCEDPGDLISCSTTKIEDGVYEFSLKLKRAVEPGDKNPFKFNLMAFDNGTDSLVGSNTQEVTINFEASDQFPPAFEELYYHGNIPNATELKHEFVCTGPGFFPAGECSPEFYECVLNQFGEWVADHFTCGPGTVYDPSIQNCNYPYNVEGCKHPHPTTKPPPPPTTTTTTTPITTTTKITTTTSSSTTSPWTLPPSVSCHHEGLNENPHEVCSNVYFDCHLSGDGHNWEETILHCHVGLVFNPVVGACDSPANTEGCPQVQ